ncbi:hypothetical protein GCM10027187_06480 [Streptosporangium sandarakinum]
MHGLVDAGVGLVTAARLVGVEQVAVLGQPVPGEVGGQLAHPPLHVAQVGERGVDGVLDGVVVRQVEGLGEVTDPAAGDDGDLTVVRGLDAGDQPQQRGLAGAVLPDDPGVLAGPDGEGDVVKNRPVAVRLGNVVKGELGGQGFPPEDGMNGSSRCPAGCPLLLPSLVAVAGLNATSCVKMEYARRDAERANG